MLKLLMANLKLFDGEGGAASGEGSPAAGESGKGEVLYGKQPDAQPETQPEGTAVGDADQQKAPEKRPFKDLINGEYKEEFDNIFQKRFKDYKELQKTNSEQSAIVDMLKSKYGVDNLEALTKAIEDDDAMWESAAYDAGMSTEQYKQYQKLERENNRLLAEQEQIRREQEAQEKVAAWQNEAMNLKAQFPNFDLEQELLNEDFRKMITRGISMDAAYKITHFDDLVSTAVTTAATQTEKAVTDNIRARGSRPQENGTTSQAAFTIKADPSKWTKADRAEVRRRVAMGEQIYL